MCSIIALDFTLLSIAIRIILFLKIIVLTVRTVFSLRQYAAISKPNNEKFGSVDAMDALGLGTSKSSYRHASDGNIMIQIDPKSTESSSPSERAPLFNEPWPSTAPNEGSSPTQRTKLMHPSCV